MRTRRRNPAASSIRRDSLILAPAVGSGWTCQGRNAKGISILKTWRKSLGRISAVLCHRKTCHYLYFARSLTLPHQFQDNHGSYLIGVCSPGPWQAHQKDYGIVDGHGLSTSMLANIITIRSISSHCLFDSSIVCECHKSRYRVQPPKFL